MLREFYILVFLTINLFVYGQRLYLKPIWGYKVNLVSKSSSNQIIVSPFYSYKDYKIYKGSSPDDIGLLIGYKFEKIPFAIESGVFRTETGSGYTVYYLRKGFLNSIGSFSGWELATIPLIVRFSPSRKFYQNMIAKGKQISFSLGLAYIFPDAGNGGSISTLSENLNDTTIISIVGYSGSSPRSKIFLDNTMFSLCTSLTFLNKKSKEILTFSLQLYYVRHEQTFDSAEISINNSVPNIYYSKSSGSGFGLTLSRDFNVFKWR
jgi:hypothetical protein